MPNPNLPRFRPDDAVSPVIGTILMVAATVIIGGAVYAGINAYNGKTAKPATDASFKAQPIDTDGDGLDDVIKLTYLSGPKDVSTVRASLNDTAGKGLAAVVSSHASNGMWTPGDFETYKLDPATGTIGAVFVSVALGESTVLDQQSALKEKL